MSVSRLLGSSPPLRHTLQEALQAGLQPVHLRLSTAAAPAFSSNICSSDGSVAAALEAAGAWALLKVAVAEQLPACQAAGCQLDRLAAIPRPLLEALAQQLPYEDVHAPAVHGRAWLAPALLAVGVYRASVHDRAGTGHMQPGGWTHWLSCQDMPAIVRVVQARQEILATLLSMHAAGSTVISGGLGALGSLAATWLLAGATGSHALVLLGRTGRLRIGGDIFTYSIADQACLSP